MLKIDLNVKETTNFAVLEFVLVKKFRHHDSIFNFLVNMGFRQKESIVMDKNKAIQSN